MNLAIFISGSGTTLDAIARAIESGRLKSNIAVVISNKPDAPGLDKYVRPRGIPFEIIPRKEYESEESFGEAVISTLAKYNADFGCLAGFLQKVPAGVIDYLKGRMINSHPGDTRKYGGPGMYGLKVHQAVLEAGEPETISTVHWVTPIYDEGAVLSQIKMLITPDITSPEELAKRLLPVEWENYVATLEKLEGKDA